MSDKKKRKAEGKVLLCTKPGCKDKKLPEKKTVSRTDYIDPLDTWNQEDNYCGGY